MNQIAAKKRYTCQ